MSAQNLMVGRIVHYQSFGTPAVEYKPEPRAAIVTQVHPESTVGLDTVDVGLCILNPTGQFFKVRVPYSNLPKPGHWNWPPRA